jgi:hypothetical protein
MIEWRAGAVSYICVKVESRRRNDHRVCLIVISETTSNRRRIVLGDEDQRALLWASPKYVRGGRQGSLMYPSEAI